MDEYTKLLRLLLAIEKKIQNEISVLINAFRDELLANSMDVSRSELIPIANGMIQQLNIPVAMVIDGYTESVISAVEQFALSQDAPIAAILITQRIGKLVSDSQQWITALSALIYQAISNENVDLDRALFSKQITQDDASAFRKGQNSMRLSTQFALFAFVNGIVIDAYMAEQDKANSRFRKMAIAKLDDATTDTCKTIHRQSVPLAGKFSLTKRPRFARFMDMPPFHWHCRTSAILIRSKQEEKLILDQLNS